MKIESVCSSKQHSQGTAHRVVHESLTHPEVHVSSSHTRR